MKQMLERLQHSFEQQRQFLGNAAHELKTPVAVMKSTLQSLVQRPRTEDEYRRGISSLSKTWNAWSSFCNGCCAWREPNSGRMERCGAISRSSTSVAPARKPLRESAIWRNHAIPPFIFPPMAQFPSAQIPKICNWSGLICWKTRYVIVPKEARS